MNAAGLMGRHSRHCSYPAAIEVEEHSDDADAIVVEEVILEGLGWEQRKEAVNWSRIAKPAETPGDGDRYHWTLSDGPDTVLGRNP